MDYDVGHIKRLSQAGNLVSSGSIVAQNAASCQDLRRIKRDPKFRTGVAPYAYHTIAEVSRPSKYKQPFNKNEEFFEQGLHRFHRPNTPENLSRRKSYDELTTRRGDTARQLITMKYFERFTNTCRNDLLGTLHSLNRPKEEKAFIQEHYKTINNQSVSKSPFDRSELMKKESRVKTPDTKITQLNKKDEVKEILTGLTKKIGKKRDHVRVSSFFDGFGAGVSSRHHQYEKKLDPKAGNRNKSSYNIVYHNHDSFDFFKTGLKMVAQVESGESNVDPKTAAMIKIENMKSTDIRAPNNVFP